jgi:phenylacetate-CoA ligase
MTHDTTDAAARALYEERCRRELAVALERTPLYEGWRERDPGQDRGIDERYSALPLLTKDDIRAHFPYGLVPRGLDLDAARARGEVSFVRTSGTADEALQNIWNQRWWDASERASWSLNPVSAAVATGTHREAILASARSVGPISEDGLLDRPRRTLGRFLYLNELGSTAQWPAGHEKRILAEIAEYQPAVLEANPSLLARVARWAAREGAEVWQPPLITLTYEFPSALHLKAIRRVFVSPIVSSYGSTEAGYVFMECEHGRLHQNTAACRVDMVPLPGMRQDGRVRPGGIGRIAATTFGNAWCPLIRFEIGDVGRIAAEPCPCGRSLGFTLSSIEGRLKSLCVAADGSPVTHGRIDRTLAAIDGLEQYRLDQVSPRLVRCAVIGEQGRGAQAARGVKDALTGIFGPGMGIEVTEAGLLLPEKSGKFLLAERSFSLEETARV